MEFITSPFKKYVLSVAVNESDESAFPEYIGGSDVSLLVGIKSAHLNPTLLSVLWSGIGVFLSPSKIFGVPGTFLQVPMSYSLKAIKVSEKKIVMLFSLVRLILNQLKPVPTT